MFLYSGITCGQVDINGITIYTYWYPINISDVDLRTAAPPSDGIYVNIEGSYNTQCLTVMTSPDTDTTTPNRSYYHLCQPQPATTSGVSYKCHCSRISCSVIFIDIPQLCFGVQISICEITISITQVD